MQAHAFTHNMHTCRHTHAHIQGCTHARDEAQIHSTTHTPKRADMHIRRHACMHRHRHKTHTFTQNTHTDI